MKYDIFCPRRTSAQIGTAKNILSRFDKDMRLLLDDWRYDTLVDVIHMRNKLTGRYKHASAKEQKMMDEVWDILRRLTNLYDDQMWAETVRRPRSA